MKHLQKKNGNSGVRKMLSKEEKEFIYDEEFYDLFVVDKICTDCCYEWGCREEKKIGTCEKCQLIINLRNEYVKPSKEAKEND